MANSGPFDGEPSPATIAKVTAWLREEGRGEPAVTFRLRDWLISRQRYWGAPIPIVHCEACGEVPVPDAELPVLLPDDVDFQPGGESPLARHPSWSKVACPTCGGDARRDTDTMDTFVDSSWYFFRYCSPRFEDGPFPPEDIARWMPVGQYTVGSSTRSCTSPVLPVLHEGAARLRAGRLRRAVPEADEPGTGDLRGGSMSKTKGNIVEPMPFVERWGSDSMRLIMLFAGPFEDDIDWKLIAGEPTSVRGPCLAGAGVRGARRGRGARRRRGTARPVEPPHPPHDQGRGRRHRAVPVQHRDLEAAGADERDANGVGRRRGSPGGGNGPGADAGPVRAVRRPRNCGGSAGGRGASVHVSSWPTLDPSLAAEDTVTLIVQVDGKVRDKIEVPVDADEERSSSWRARRESVRRAVGRIEVIVKRSFARPSS